VKVSGEATLHAPIDRVWAALNDPAVLVRTIPGCASTGRRIVRLSHPSSSAVRCLFLTY